jgi:hypothetical protein
MAIIRLVDGVIFLAESNTTVNVDVLGAGTVSGSGVYVDAPEITLTATAASSNVFQRWEVNGVEVLSNPYTFSPSVETVDVVAYFITTIESYLSGVVPNFLSEAMINTIRIKRGIAYNADVTTLATSVLELATADAYMLAATMPSSYTGSKDSDGGWSHSEASHTLTSADKGMYKAQANAIYKKYLDSSYRATVSITALNGTPYYGG